MKWSWATYALLSALFAGATAALAKMGVANVPSNLATAFRTIIVLVFASAIVVATGEVHHIGQLSRQNLIFLTLSGVGTGLSWLCYFKALQLGPISSVAPIDKLSFIVAMTLGVLIFHEKLTWQLGVGALLIGAGVLLTLQK